MICIVLAVVWGLLLNVQTLTIAGKAVSYRIALFGLAFISGTIAFYFAWDMILMTASLMLVLSLLHAMYHELPPNTVTI